MKIILLIAFLALSGVSADRPRRSVGGASISIEQAPYFASIQRGGKHVCGGALISPKHVLTAAYCVADSSGKKVSDATVVTGRDDKYSGGSVQLIEKIHLHPDFKKKARRERRPDMAIILLSKPIALNGKQNVIALPLGKPKFNEKAALIAFETKPSPSTSAHLHEFHTKMLPFARCAPEADGLTDYLGSLCGFHQLGQGVVHGDQGGPLVHQGTLVGIASFLESSTGFNDRYMNVYSHMRFISDKTGCHGDSCKVV